MEERDLAIAITNRCNMGCSFCYTDAFYQPASSNLNEIPEDELSTEEWLNVIDQAIAERYTGLHIYGGEPFMRRDLKTICRYTSQNYSYFGRPMRILIATNGTLVSDSDIHWIKEVNASISLTINNLTSIDPFIHALIRTLIDEKINFVISTCITTENITGYADFVESLNKEFGVNNISYFGIYFSKIGRGKYEGNLLIPAEQWISFRKEVMARYPNVLIEKIYGNPDSLFSCSCSMESGNFLTIGSMDCLPALCSLKPDYKLGQIRTENLNDILARLSIFTFVESELKDKRLAKNVNISMNVNMVAPRILRIKKHYPKITGAKFKEGTSEGNCSVHFSLHENNNRNNEETHNTRHLLKTRHRSRT